MVELSHFDLLKWLNFIHFQAFELIMHVDDYYSRVIALCASFIVYLDLINSDPDYL